MDPRSTALRWSVNRHLKSLCWIFCKTIRPAWRVLLVLLTPLVQCGTTRWALEYRAWRRRLSGACSGRCTATASLKYRADGFCYSAGCAGCGGPRIDPRFGFDVNLTFFPPLLSGGGLDMCSCHVHLSLTSIHDYVLDYAWLRALKFLSCRRFEVKQIILRPCLLPGTSVITALSVALLLAGLQFFVSIPHQS